MKSILIVGVLAFGMGGCLGAKSVTPEVDFVEVPRTKIITKEAPPPEEIEVVSESCLEAVRLADLIYREASAIYSRGDEQIDIFSEARKALITGGGFSEVEELQRALQRKQIEHLADLAETLPRYEDAREDCRDSTATD